MQDLLARCTLCTTVIYSGCILGQYWIKHMLQFMHMIVINKPVGLLWCSCPPPLDIPPIYMDSQFSILLSLLLAGGRLVGAQLPPTSNNQQHYLEYSRFFSCSFPCGFSEPELPGAAWAEHAIRPSGKPALMKISGQKKSWSFWYFVGFGLLATFLHRKPLRNRLTLAAGEL